MVEPHPESVPEETVAEWVGFSFERPRLNRTARDRLDRLEVPEEILFGEDILADTEQVGIAAWFLEDSGQSLE